MKKRFIALACILFVTFVAFSVFGCINPKPKQLSELVPSENIEKIIFTCTPLLIRPDDPPPANDPYSFELNEEQKTEFFRLLDEISCIEMESGWLHSYSWHYEIYYLDGRTVWFFGISMYNVREGEFIPGTYKAFELIDVDWEIFLLENPALSAQ